MHLIGKNKKVLTSRLSKYHAYMLKQEKRCFKKTKTFQSCERKAICFALNKATLVIE
jgi:hypothetical protein